MALKVKLAPRSALGKPISSKVLKIAGLACGIVFLFFIAIFSFYYFKYKHIVDMRLEKPLFTNTAKIYAAPREVRPGQKLTAEFIAQELRAAGYSEDGSASAMGTYSMGPRSIVVHPGPQSYHAPDSATISFSGSTVNDITDANGQQLSAYELEPLLITGLSVAIAHTGGPRSALLPWLIFFTVGVASRFAGRPLVAVTTLGVLTGVGGILAGADRRDWRAATASALASRIASVNSCASLSIRSR